MYCTYNYNNLTFLSHKIIFVNLEDDNTKEEFEKLYHENNILMIGLKRVK